MWSLAPKDCLAFVSHSEYLFFALDLLEERALSRAIHLKLAVKPFPRTPNESTRSIEVPVRELTLVRISSALPLAVAVQLALQKLGLSRGVGQKRDSDNFRRLSSSSKIRIQGVNAILHVQNAESSYFRNKMVSVGRCTSTT